MLGDELVKTSLICPMCYHTSIRQSSLIRKFLTADIFTCLNPNVSLSTSSHKMVVMSPTKAWSQVRMGEWLDAYSCPICYNPLRFCSLVHGVLGEPVVLLVTCIKHHANHAIIRRPATKRFLRYLETWSETKYYENKRKDYQEKSYSQMGYRVPSEEERQANDILYQLAQHRDPLTDKERTDVKANLIKTLTQLKDKYAPKSKTYIENNNTLTENDYDRWL